MKAIRSESIDTWLARLAKSAEVLVPQANAAGDIVLGTLGQSPRSTDYIRLADTPKRVLLPQSEDVLEFTDGRPTARQDETNRIIFGLRPCDAAAIRILDGFFSRKFVDPNYEARRSRLRLIVVACAHSGESCFCASAGTGPVADSGFDLQLLDVGDVYLVMHATKAGQEMIDAGLDLMVDPPTDAAAQVERFTRESIKSQQLKLDMKRAQEIIRRHGEDPTFWKKIADRCLMCAGCTYLCPTCTCYDIVDVALAEGRGTRQRRWDSCILEGFTREASGHNPRSDQGARCGHRYLHKLGGSDLPGLAYRCVGCGRCSDACISNVGIIRVLQEILADQEAAEPGAAAGTAERK